VEKDLGAKIAREVARKMVVYIAAPAASRSFHPAGTRAQVRPHSAGFWITQAET